MELIKRVLAMIVIAVGVLIPFSPAPANAATPLAEIISLRTESSKTYDLGNGKRQLVTYTGAIHYKNDYTSLTEQWKDISLVWVNNSIVTAPYEATLINKKLTFKDKKTGQISTIELLSVEPAGFPFEIVPFNEGVSFRHTLPSNKIPFEAQFRVTGNTARLSTRAFDDGGELELQTSLIGDNLTEKMSEIKDKKTKLARPANGSVRIDPTLTVQPSAKDNYMYITDPTTNYGGDTEVWVYGKSSIGAVARAILEFDISAIPIEQVVDNASLQLYYKDFSGADPVGLTVWAYKLTRTDWVEAQSTWNIYKTSNSWTSAGGDYVTSNPSGNSTTVPAAYGWMTWSIKAIVQDAYTASNPTEILVKYEDEAQTITPAASTALWSKEYAVDTSLRPKLVIDYSTALPAVTTDNVTNVEEMTATLSGNITSIGGSIVTQRGFEWGTSSGIYTSNSSSSGAFGAGTFTDDVTGLTKGELYYFRAIAKNDTGWGYGSELTFLTKPDEPTSLVAAPTANATITLTWTKGAGAQNTYIRGKDGSYPTDRTDGSETYNGTASTVNDTGLIGGHTYYYRAWSWATEGSLEQYSDLYAQDSEGAIEFVGITTNNSTDIDTTSANISANITSLGGSAGSSYQGFVWDTVSRVSPGNVAPSATAYANSWQRTLAMGTGNFTHNVDNLTAGTTYYVRGAANNIWGWVYGSEVSFTALDLMLWFQPNTIIIGTALPNRATGNDNGVITWGNNPAGIIVSIAEAASEPILPTVGAAETATMMPPTEGAAPIVGTGGTEGTNFLFYDLFKLLQIHEVLPTMSYLWEIVGTIFVLLTGAVILLTTKLEFASWLAVCILIGLGYAMNIWDIWLLYLYAPTGLAYILLKKVTSL